MWTDKEKSFVRNPSAVGAYFMYARCQEDEKMVVLDIPLNAISEFRRFSVNTVSDYW